MKTSFSQSPIVCISRISHKPVSTTFSPKFPPWLLPKNNRVKSVRNIAPIHLNKVFTVGKDA